LLGRVPAGLSSRKPKAQHHRPRRHRRRHLT